MYRFEGLKDEEAGFGRTIFQVLTLVSRSFWNVARFSSRRVRPCVIGVIDDGVTSLARMWNAVLPCFSSGVTTRSFTCVFGSRLHDSPAMKWWIVL